MPKKNGFCLFMEERRDGVLAAGHEIPGGKRDLAELLSADWKALSQEERNKYSEKAKQLNERALRKKASPVPYSGKVQKPLTNPTSFLASDEMPPEHKMAIEAGRATVFQIFRSQNWNSHPIVICNFTLYNEPEYYHDMHVPAEIGLSAMSLKNGVIDNYARIIDMKSIPLGRDAEFTQMAKKLGIPAPGTVPEFADYEPIMMILESFLKKYQGIFQGQQDELHVYILESDFEVVRHSLDWLYEKSGIRLPVKILSLDLYAYLASSEHARAAVNASSLNYQKGSSLLSAQGSSIMATISRFREVGQPLNQTFVHPTNLPMTVFGIFLSEMEVEAGIKKMENYKYFEELCCVYHIRSGKELQNCALNISNRYAFSLLEILTLSNEVPIKPGYHYPRVDSPQIEKMRRTACIQRWGISNWEEQMKIYTPEEYVEEESDPTVVDQLPKPKEWNRRDDQSKQNTHPNVYQPRVKAQRNAKQNDEASIGMEGEDGAAGYSVPMPDESQTLDGQKRHSGSRQPSQTMGRNVGGASSLSPLVEISSTELDENGELEEHYTYKFAGKVPNMFLGPNH